MRRRIWLIAAVALLPVLALVSTSCAQDEDEAAPSARRAAPEAPFAVTTFTETFVDPSRPTPASPAEAGTTTRTLETTIAVPDASDPVPLIVLAHGIDGHPRKFSELVTAWAAAGYVVAVPEFPRTSDESPGGTVLTDYAQQPGDVSFVVDQVIDRADDASSPLHDRVDPGRLGVAGFSLGGGTTLGVTFNSCCRDDRVDAAVVMAGFRFPFDGELDLSGVPLLIMHGDADPRLPYGGAVETYALAAPPKYFMTILGGGHAPPFEDADDPADDVVTITTIEFWNAYLRDDARARDALTTVAVVPGLTTFEADPG